MNPFLSIRRWERPDRPQAVYKGALALWEAFLYPAIADETRNGWRAPDRAYDETYLQQTAPQDGWRNKVVDNIIRTWAPIFEGEAQTFRTTERARLEVRTHGWAPQLLYKGAVSLWESWYYPAVTDITRNSYRAPDRFYDETYLQQTAPQDGWRNAAVDGVVRTWTPTFAAALQSYRMLDDAVLDRRHTTTPSQDWVPNAAVDAIVRTWIAALTAQTQTYAVPARAALDVRTHPWAPQLDWLPEQVDNVVASWVAGVEINDVRMADRAKSPLPYLPARGLVDWIAAVLTQGGPTVAQFFPALSAALLAERSRAGVTLDRRLNDWSQLFGTPEDASAWQQVPAWLQALGINYRTPDSAKLDVRQSAWSVGLAWFAALATPPTVAQTWPALLQNLGAFTVPPTRPGVDVRNPWAPGVAWVARVVDAVVSTWAPLFSAPPPLAAPPNSDRRAYEIGTPGWWTVLFTTVTVAQTWPAILQNLGALMAPPNRPGTEVRSLWAPDLAWVQDVVESIVSTWTAVFTAPAVLVSKPADRRLPEYPPPSWWAALFTTATIAQTWPAVLQLLGLYERTADRPRMDVRSTPTMPTAGWVAGIVDATVKTWSPIFDAQHQAARAPDRVTWDVRRHQWQPAFTWVARVVDAVVLTWSAVFGAQASVYRSPARPALDVRGHEWLPQHGWLMTAQPGSHTQRTIEVRSYTSTHDVVSYTIATGLLSWLDLFTVVSRED